MEKMIKNGAEADLLHRDAIKSTTKEEKDDDPKKLDKILGKYNTIFQELLHGIPPPRSIDYIIELIPSYTPIKKNITVIFNNIIHKSSTVLLHEVRVLSQIRSYLLGKRKDHIDSVLIIVH
jgi:hypothetical protein